jgi:N-methylhydantoinase A
LDDSVTKHYVLGTDIGGTFTDTVVMDDAGEVSIFKVPSTPDDKSEGVLASIRLASDAMGLEVGEFLGRVDTFYHGTTVGMNAVLTRTGSRVGFITTRGFRDTLPMMRASRIPSQDVLGMDMPSFRDDTAFVPIYMIEEVSERIDSDGEEIQPLDEEDLARAVESLVDQGAEAIAVCLLWSIRNPSHELRVKQYINDTYPGMFVSISYEVMPVIREFERSVVTLVNSYVANVISEYMRVLTRRLEEQGFESPFLVMQSTGGALSVAEAVDKPCKLFLSGPAGGVTGSMFLGAALGHENILTVDMGGTSCDIGVIIEGRQLVVTRSKLAEYDAALPKLDISTIGAGGGSIAWLDHGELLRIGPKSAAAQPGPACYNRGGTEPTVTDANVILGYIDPKHFLDGRMEIRPDLAEQAVGRLAGKMGLDLVDTAIGIIDIVNSNMCNAIRNMTVERGHDPRDFIMMSFGGAGPLHAGALIQDLGIPAAVVPYTATAHSAYGFVCSDISHHLVISRPIRHPSDPTPFNEIFEELERDARDTLRREGIAERDMSFKRLVDMRFCGQVFDISVEVPRKLLTAEEIENLKTAFEDAYDQIYGKGTGWKDAGVEAVNFRLDATGKMPKPKLRQHDLVTSNPDVARAGTGTCYFAEAEGFVSVPVYDGARLRPGMTVNGPGIIALHSTSAIIDPGLNAHVDAYRNIVIEQFA